MPSAFLLCYENDSEAGDGRTTLPITEVRFTGKPFNFFNFAENRTEMNGTISKFSPITVTVKKNIRRLRLNRGYSMNEGARLLSVSRKQLEDIETVRNYGCHLDLELLAKIKAIYQVSLDDLLGELPADHYSDYYSRPRKQPVARA